MARSTTEDVDARVFHTPSVRIIAEWTPTMIRLAERRAEAGDFLYAGALCDFLLADDRVLGGLQAREDRLFGLTPSFEPGMQASARVAKAINDDWWVAYPESTLRQMLQWGLLLGFSLHRHEWSRNADHGGRLLPTPAHWHPQHIKWSWQKREWSVRDDAFRSHVVVAGDGAWILHTPFGAQRPWASGLWRALSRWALLKQYARSDWARHSEKSSTLVAHAPEGTDPKQRAQLANDLAGIGTDAVITLPVGFDLKLVEVAAKTRDIYNAQVEAADLAITTLIRGGNLTTNVSEGSRAAAQTQEKAGDQAKLRFDAASISTTLHIQSLSIWTEYNFGNRRLTPWVKWPTDPEEDKEAFAKLLSTAADGVEKVEKLGFEVDAKALVERLGVGDVLKRRGERPKDTTPPPDGNGDGEDQSGDNEQPSDAKAARAMLASGASAEANRGFLEGQGYVDDLVESYQGTASELLQKDLDRVLDLVDSVTSYDEVEAKLAELYKGLDPQRLTEMVERFMQVADIAGRAAVRQDVA